MPKVPPDTPIDPEAELDFSGCSNLDDCLKRVSGVLLHANDVHKQTCSTRNRARNLLKTSEGISDSDSALIIAHAVFPNHCIHFFNLKKALYPNGVSRLEKEERVSLSKKLKNMKHTPLVALLQL